MSSNRWPIWSCAALFTHRNKVWSDPAIVVRLRDGKWVEPLVESLSPQGLAGYRQRLERIVREIPKSRGKVDLGGQVAAYVAQRHLENTGQVVVEVRVVNTSWPAGVPAMAQPAGHWGWPPLAQVSKKRQKEWYHGKLVAGKWVEVKPQPAPKVIPPEKPGLAGAEMKPPQRPKRVIRLPALVPGGGAKK